MHIKTNSIFIDNAEGLDIAMSRYNLLEHSDNYSMTSGSLWNYYRDEVNDAANENDIANYRVNNKQATTGRSFVYKTKIKEKTLAITSKLDTKVVVLLKYLSNFWRSLDLLLNNFEMMLNLSCSKDCTISEISKPQKYLLIQLLIQLLTVFH